MNSYADTVNVSAENLELLAYFLEENGEVDISSANGISPANRSEERPLSFAQQRLWFLDQLEPGSPLYNVSLVVRLTGQLDVAILARALTEVVRRHEVLRTTFSLVDGQPVQVIREVTPVPLALIGLTALPAQERESESRHFVNAEARRPFDLSGGPLLRARLVKLDEQEHVLVLVMHHIVSDGWSTGVLVREVSTLYEAFSAGRPSPLGELPIQYADYAVWQRQRLTGELLEEELSYWKKQLAGAPPVLELPTDRARPAVQSFRGSSKSFTLDEKLSRALKELSRGEGATLFMTLLAGFQILLSRYSGQTDVVVGTPIAGRDRVETEGLIGFFINTLALRADLSGNPSFREFLQRVRDVCLGAYAHQEVPFEKGVEELQPERSLSHSPVFQVYFGLQSAPQIKLELEGLSFKPIELERGTAQYDLVFNITDDGQTLIGIVDYNTDLYETATIKRLILHYQALLRSVTERPPLNLREIGELLAEWDSWRWVAEGAEIEKASLSRLKKVTRQQTGNRGPSSLQL
jgi:hypothetical protein